MATIQLKTPIPGPKSKALAERRTAAVPRGLSHATPVYVAKAEGAWLEDVDGNRYIDFAGGIGCLNVGHRASRWLPRFASSWIGSCTPASRSRPTKATSALASG